MYRKRPYWLWVDEQGYPVVYPVGEGKPAAYLWFALPDALFQTLPPDVVVPLDPEAFYDPSLRLEPFGALLEVYRPAEEDYSLLGPWRKKGGAP